MDFASRIGVKGKATIYRYINGVSIPRPDTMLRIEEETGGLVTPNDFFPGGNRGNENLHEGQEGAATP